MNDPVMAVDPRAPRPSEIGETSRDVYARQRTHLANERTLLAFWRTALALLGLGIVLLEVLGGSVFKALGIAALAASAALFVFGTVHFFLMKHRIG